jgi:hypothetical protein
MSPRTRLLHDWLRQVGALLPGTHVQRARVLGLLVAGMIWSGSITLLKIAEALPLAAADMSTEGRFRRWLKHDKVVVRPLWAALLPALLASRAGQELTLVLDPTPQNDRFAILQLGVVCRRRVLPVAWRVVAQQTPWPQRQIGYFRELFAETAAALPPGCAVTVVADRGLTAAELIDLCREFGWRPMLRLSANDRQGCTVRLADGAQRPIWALVTGPGQRWSAAVELFQGAGWRRVLVTIRWDAGQREPWLLLADELRDGEAVRCYRRRMRVEATYEDCKKRGWNIEASKVTIGDRFDRLLLALHLAYWWTTQLGRRAIRRGERRRFDRVDRRDLSVVRLGKAWVRERLELPKRRPPLPFRATPQGWVFTWLA